MYNFEVLKLFECVEHIKHHDDDKVVPVDVAGQFFECIICIFTTEFKHYADRLYVLYTLIHPRKVSRF